MISINDLISYEHWFAYSYPSLPLDIEGITDINIILSTKDLFLPIMTNNLYTLDLESLENNYVPASLEKVHNKFYVNDACSMLQDIFNDYFKDRLDDHSFIISSLGRGIFNPYYIVNTMLEHIVISIRDVHSHNGFYVPISNLSDLGDDIYYKICTSIICSLRTSLNKEMNVLGYHIDNGTFTQFKLLELLDIFPMDSALMKFLGNVYELLFNQVNTMKPDETFSLRVDYNPDVYNLRSRYPVFNIITAR